MIMWFQSWCGFDNSSGDMDPEVRTAKLIHSVQMYCRRDLWQVDTEIPQVIKEHLLASGGMSQGLTSQKQRVFLQTK